MNNFIGYPEYTYIWLYNNEIHSHLSNEPLTEFGKEIDGFEYTIEPIYKHANFINGPIYFCQTTITNYDGENVIKTVPDKLLLESNSIKECEEALNNCDQEIKIGFNFIVPKIDSKLFNKFFGDVINWDTNGNLLNDRVMINVKHENPLISCYYYVFIRYFMELSKTIENYKFSKFSMLELMNKFMKPDNLFIDVANLVLNTSRNGLGIEITMPNIKSISDKKSLSDNYGCYHNSLINDKDLVEYIFNKKYDIPILSLSDYNKDMTEDFKEDTELKYCDYRSNIYTNPFNLLKYHLTIIDLYSTEKKRYQIYELDDITNKLINQYLGNEEETFGTSSYFEELLDNYSEFTDDNDYEHLLLISKFYQYIMDIKECNYGLLINILTEIKYLFTPLEITSSETVIEDIYYLIKSNFNLIPKIYHYDYYFELITLKVKSLPESEEIMKILKSIYKSRIVIKYLVSEEEIYELCDKIIAIIDNINHNFTFSDELLEIVKELESNILKGRDISNNFKSIIEIVENLDFESKIENDVFYEKSENLEEEKNSKPEQKYYFSSWLF